MFVAILSAKQKRRGVLIDIIVDGRVIGTDLDPAQIVTNSKFTYVEGRHTTYQNTHTID
jgi:hypothetical protein